MSEEPKPKSADQELSAEDLDQAAGGAVNYFLNLNGIKGEPQDTVVQTPQKKV
jgi:hypothetical protein